MALGKDITGRPVVELAHLALHVARVGLPRRLVLLRHLTRIGLGTVDEKASAAR